MRAAVKNFALIHPLLIFAYPWLSMFIHVSYVSAPSDTPAFFALLYLLNIFLAPIVAIGWPLAVSLYLNRLAKIQIPASLMISFFVIILALMVLSSVTNYLFGTEFSASLSNRCKECSISLAILFGSGWFYIYWAAAKVLTEADRATEDAQKVWVPLFFQFVMLPIFVFALHKRIKRCSAYLADL